jgi:hypothetical protein
MLPNLLFVVYVVSMWQSVPEIDLVVLSSSVGRHTEVSLGLAWEN